MTWSDYILSWFDSGIAPSCIVACVFAVLIAWAIWTAMKIGK